MFKRGKYEGKKQPVFRLVLTLFLAAALTVVLLLNLFTHVFSVVQYYGSSMEPTLQDRQVLVFLRTDQVKPGDVTAFYYNNQVLVRRVIAQGGTSIELDDRGLVTVDGTELQEPYLAEASVGLSNISYPFTVPHGELFVMGDNRPVSMDSRLQEIGTIPQNRIIGKLLFSFG